MLEILKSIMIDWSVNNNNSIARFYRDYLLFRYIFSRVDRLKSSGTTGALCRGRSPGHRV